MRIVLAYPAVDQALDGIRDYSRRVAEEMRAEGYDATLIRPRGGLALAVALARALPTARKAAVLVQYSPFSWGRWGFAPGSIASLCVVRVLRPRARLILCVHEAYVPLAGPKQSLIGAWQRVQLRALVALAHAVITVSGRLRDQISRLRPARSVSHVPVGSNLPDERAGRVEARRLWGLEGHMVLATFATGHETQLTDPVARAATATAPCSPSPTALLLGAGPHSPGQLNGVKTVRPGYLDPQELARALAAADVFLLAFSDGASTRRTTLIAALQHGLATITTSGPSTEAFLSRSGALLLADAEDPDGFSRQATRLVREETLRASLGEEARRLYEQSFSWPVICVALCNAITTALNGV